MWVTVPPHAMAMLASASRPPGESVHQGALLQGHHDKSIKSVGAGSWSIANRRHAEAAEQQHTLLGHTQLQ